MRAAGGFLGLLLVLGAWQAHAQAPLSNFRCQTLAPDTGWQALGQQTVYPASLVVGGLSAERYRFSPQRNALRLLPPLPADSVRACFRVLAVGLHRPRFRRPIGRFDSSAYYFNKRFRPKPSAQQAEEDRNTLFQLEGIEQSGQISRGISFGNRQSADLNSALNLQLEGELRPGLELTATVTDQQVPFQPEGNTQELQELDRIFLQLRHRIGSISAGDLVAKNGDSKYLKYYKNVLGARAEAHYQAFDSSQAQTSVLASSSKGRFRSDSLQVQEGVQGPYRLRGNNGETFIIVLAGSEKVYLDGELLERGFDKDYTIDYNRAEITFTNNVVITRFSRVRVDFEYSEQNYPRSVLTASHRQSYGKWDFAFQTYREADNHNNPFNLTLDSATASALNAAGETSAQALIPGERSSQFNEDFVLYTKQDTLGREIFVFTPEEQEEMYQVTFSQVGQGKGAYAPAQESVNGRVYEYVGPGQGNFAPMRAVVLPQLKSMSEASVAYNFSENHRLQLTGAASTRDENRYSAIGSGDDQGQALGLEHQVSRKNAWGQYDLSSTSNLEYNQKNFRRIDRFRPVEFARNWGLPRQDSTRADLFLFQNETALRRSATKRFENRLSLRRSPGQADGFREELQLAQNYGHWHFEGKGFVSRSRLPQRTLRWEKWEANPYVRTALGTAGYRYRRDNSRFARRNNDSLTSVLLNFQSHEIYAENPDTARHQYGLAAEYRQDQTAREGRLVPQTHARMIKGHYALTATPWQSLRVNATWRELETRQDTANAPPEQTLMGRLDWNLQLLQNHIRSELTFATTTGQELKREFQFIKAPVVGEGTHGYEDFDGDGVKDLDEFFPASRPEDKRYVKVFLPTNEFIKAFSNNFSYRLNLSGPRSWRGRQGWRRHLSLLSAVGSWTIDRRFTQNSLLRRFVPPVEVRQEALLATDEVVRGTFFYNRGARGFGLEYGYRAADQKQLLTNGFESRSTDEHRGKIRKSLGEWFILSDESTYESIANRSDFLQARDYAYQSLSTLPELLFQPNPNWRLTTALRLERKEAEPMDQGRPLAIVRGVELGGRWNQAGKRSLSATAEFREIRFSGGEANSPLGFDMLEALSPGNNFLWNARFQQQLKNGLQITLQYRGRKSQEQRTVHFGTVQVSALF